MTSFQFDTGDHGPGFPRLSHFWTSFSYSCMNRQRIMLFILPDPIICFAGCVSHFAFFSLFGLSWIPICALLAKTLCKISRIQSLDSMPRRGVAFTSELLVILGIKKVGLGEFVCFWGSILCWHLGQNGWNDTCLMLGFAFVLTSWEKLVEWLGSCASLTSRVIKFDAASHVLWLMQETLRLADRCSSC